MAYVDYKTQTQLRGSVTTISPASPDGAPAAWIHDGESAEQTITNRPVDALALNMDNMKIPLDEQKALTQVGSMTAFSGSSLTIDPDAGTGSDIDYATAGYLYVGNSDYSGASQDDYDTLFQFTDDDNNEVMFDGEEVKVTSIAPPGAALGNGFFNGAIATLTLGTDSTPGGVSLPSGNYRLKYARETTLATLPDDALIKAEIRGGQEGSAENQKPMWAVCAPAGSRGDYVGADAFEEAVANGEPRIYLKAGTYGPLTSNTSLSSVEYIMGEDNGSVVIQITGDFNISSMPSGEGFQVSVTSTSASNNICSLRADSILRNVDLLGLTVSVSFGNIIENMTCGGFGGVLVFPTSASIISVKDLRYDPREHSTGPLFDFGSNVSRVTLDRLRPYSQGSFLADDHCLNFDGATNCSKISIKNSHLEVGVGSAAYLSDVDFLTIENCVFENTSTGDPTFYVQDAVSKIALENCEIHQLATSTVTLNAAFAAEATLEDSSFKNCKIESDASRAAYTDSSFTRVSFENCDFVSTEYALHIAAAMQKVMYSDCIFSSGKTIVDTDIARGHSASFSNCRCISTASDWYNEPAVKLLSFTHDVVDGGTYRDDSGIRIENVYIEDSWSQGHDSPNNPTVGTTGGTAGFAVVELEGVSGRNLAVNRGTVTYNVQNGAWLKMTHCNVDMVGVRVDNASAMTPHTYSAGSVSSGMIEGRGHSRIRGLRYGNCLKGEVDRPVIWLRADYTFGTTTYYNPARPVVIEDVEIAFDNASAYRAGSGFEEPLLMLLARASRVNGFVWNAGSKIASRNDTGSIPATPSLIQLAGTHNILERAFIRMSTTSQGTVQTVVALGDGADDSVYANIVKDCVFDITHDLPADAGSIDFPWRIINAPSGSGATVDNCNIICRASPNNVINIAIRMVSYHSRVSNNHLDFVGNLDSTASGQILFDGSVDQSGTCIGNVIRVRGGSTTPTIGGGAVSSAANSLQAPTATPAFPL